MVIIGAGNVGCDVAFEAYQAGAEQVTLVDIQKPLAFGKEKASAEKLGAKFRWPISTKEVTAEGLVTDKGELIPAQTVIISIGDIPAVGFLPDGIELFRGWIKTDATGRTSDRHLFAVGDVEKPGLATDALGRGKIAAGAIVAELARQGVCAFQAAADLARQVDPGALLPAAHCRRHPGRRGHPLLKLRHLSRLSSLRDHLPNPGDFPAEARHPRLPVCLG